MTRSWTSTTTTTRTIASGSATTRGDTVLAVYPFTTLTGAKIRPAVVVSCDTDNRKLADVVLALVTSVVPVGPLPPAHVLIDLATPDGAATKLLRTSVVKCNHLATIGKSQVRGRVGRIPPVLMARIDAALKVALELP